MPDNLGNLSEEERAKIADFVNGKAKPPGDNCTTCGSGDLRVGTQMLSIPSGGPHMAIGAMYLPIIPIICHNCGHIRYFHAGPLGLAPDTIPTGD